MEPLLRWLEDFFTRDWEVYCGECNKCFVVPREKVILARQCKGPIRGCKTCKNRHSRVRRETNLRQRAHTLFDRTWMEGYWTRDVAYNWISALFKLPRGEAHIRTLQDDQVVVLIEKIKERFPALAE